jgi:pimeloyl-ACP methyl ester carboxylesterase
LQDKLHGWGICWLTALLATLVCAGLGGSHWLRAQEDGKPGTGAPDRTGPAKTEAETEKKLKDLTAAINDYLSKTDPKSAAYQINAPFLVLRLEKARLLAARSSSYYYGSGRAEDELKLAQQALELSKRGTPIYEGMTGLQERAYVCPADRSPQPYWVNVPKAYTKDKQWPLVVFLHGYDPDIDKVNAWLPSRDVLQVFEDRGYLLLIPYGRRNTDFVGIGEVDTLRATEQCRKAFNIDPDRVYLAGVSMGGYGVYAVGMHYPDLFAAIAPACGRTDHYFWQKLKRDEVEGFKRPLIDADNPIDLVENLRNVPTHLQQGQYDTLVDPEHSHRILQEFEKRGFQAKYEEIAGEDHWIYFKTDCYVRMLDWFDRFRRNPVPKVVTYTTYMPKYRRAYWVALDEFAKWGQRTTVRAEAAEGNALDITTQNVAALTVTFAPGLLDYSREVVVKVNGNQAFAGKPKLGDHLAIRVGTPERGDVPNGALPRSWRLSGPVKEAYNEAFSFVYGTVGDEAADKDLLDQARRAAREWQQFADGIPEVKPDTAVTDEDLKARNVVLFGDERTNSLVTRMRDKLPFRMENGTVRIGERTYDYKADGLGFMLCYPNPLAVNRLAVVCVGLFWGDALPINHKFDLLPDFIVYSGEVDMSDKTNRFLCAGFFDKDWRFNPDTVWLASANGRAEAASQKGGAWPDKVTEVSARLVERKS